MKKFIAALLIILLICAGCSKTEKLPDEGGNNPPPTVNVNGKQYIVSGNTPSEPPENAEISGTFDELSEWPDEHGETNMDFLVGQPYVFENGELFVFVENWPFQNEKLQYVYTGGWIKCS